MFTQGLYITDVVQEATQCLVVGGGGRVGVGCPCVTEEGVINLSGRRKIMLL